MSPWLTHNFWFFGYIFVNWLFHIFNIWYQCTDCKDAQLVATPCQHQSLKALTRSLPKPIYFSYSSISSPLLTSLLVPGISAPFARVINYPSTSIFSLYNLQNVPRSHLISTITLLSYPIKRNQPESDTKLNREMPLDAGRALVGWTRCEVNWIIVMPSADMAGMCVQKNYFTALFKDNNLWQLVLWQSVLQRIFSPYSVISCMECFSYTVFSMIENVAFGCLFAGKELVWWRWWNIELTRSCQTDTF